MGGNDLFSRYLSTLSKPHVDWWDFISETTIRRKIFVSYHHDRDQVFYDQFVGRFEQDYECITDNSLSRLFDSANPEYVMQRIRDSHISGSSCTFVLCGAETPYRKYVDWEIKSTLVKKHGLIGIELPTARRAESRKVIVPSRLHDNIQSGYAQWLDWTNLEIGPAYLKLCIEIANLKSSDLIVNDREIARKNGTLPTDFSTGSFSALSMLLGGSVK
jgi:hypothetical protein